MLDKCELTTDLSSSPKKQISRWGFKCRGVVWKADPDVTGKGENAAGRAGSWGRGYREHLELSPLGDLSEHV